jgi:hypothetical protein
VSEYWSDAGRFWSVAEPPNRPGSDVLKILSTTLDPLDRRSPVAVLGSTVEYRRLLNQMGFEHVDVLERSEAFYRWSSTFVPEAQREQLVLRDWRHLPDSTMNRYVAVLSDLTIGNLPYDEQPGLYEIVRRMLSVGGIFADRMVSFERPGQSLQLLDDSYGRTPLTGETMNRFNADYLFSSELVTTYQIVDTTKFLAILAERFAQNNHLLAFQRAVQDLTPSGHLWYYGRLWNERGVSLTTSGLEVVAEHGLVGFGGNSRLRVLMRER